MKVFYTKIDENLMGKYSRSELRKLQSELGRNIVTFVGKNIYKLTDTNIIIENNKPRFKNSDIQFSITHSKNIVLVAFDEFSIGVDIEYMKDRDFKKFLGHYGITSTDKIGFYKQWTELEAKIKLQENAEWIYSQEFNNDYMLTIASSNKQSKPEIELSELSEWSELLTCHYEEGNSLPDDVIQLFI